jgi:hypothetical protein
VSIKHLLLIISLFTSALSHAESLSLPTIDAQFETTQCALPCKAPSTNAWWLFRANNQVELRSIDKITEKPSPRSEIWTLNPDGKLGYLFLMHEDKRAIEYLFDDLKILGINPDQTKWETEAQLVTENELAHMQKSSIKTVAFQGYATVGYEGEINSAKVNIIWIPELKIPVKIVYTYPNSTSIVQLTKLITGTELATVESKQLKTTKDVLSHYEQVYYTDIGDMEDNTKAQVWIAKARGALGIHEHQH